MKDYAQPITKENPDLLTIHVGNNDLPNKKQPDATAEDIVKLALKLKTNSCDESVSNIVSRGHQYKKGIRKCSLKKASPVIFEKVQKIILR